MSTTGKRLDRAEVPPEMRRISQTFMARSWAFRLHAKPPLWLIVYVLGRTQHPVHFLRLLLRSCDPDLLPAIVQRGTTHLALLIRQEKNRRARIVHNKVSRCR